MGHTRNKHTQLWASSCYCLLTTTVLTSDHNITILMGYIRSATTHTHTDVGQRLSSQRKWDMQLLSLCGNRDGGAHTAERQREGYRMEETGRGESWLWKLWATTGVISLHLRASHTESSIRIYGNTQCQRGNQSDIRSWPGKTPNFSLRTEVCCLTPEFSMFMGWHYLLNLDHIVDSNTNPTINTSSVKLLTFHFCWTCVRDALTRFWGNYVVRCRLHQQHTPTTLFEIACNNGQYKQSWLDVIWLAFEFQSAGFCCVEH